VGRWVGVVALLNLPVHESQFFEYVSFDDYSRIKKGESHGKECHARMHIFFLFFHFFTLFLESSLPPCSQLASELVHSAARIDPAERLFVCVGFSKLLSGKLEPSQAPLPSPSKFPPKKWQHAQPPSVRALPPSKLP
jgi:hypothetical protein